MGKPTHQIVGETTQGRWAKAKQLGGETTQCETTQDEQESGRNDPLPVIYLPFSQLPSIHILVWGTE